MRTVSQETAGASSARNIGVRWSSCQNPSSIRLNSRAKVSMTRERNSMPEPLSSSSFRR
ncbi:MAG: hypothetical protein L6W00_24260 [Lentisphaeria bacterium]|nr:MAG: hypothetical protein L6W00_24260 [Lentisphaeria bacterium]